LARAARGDRKKPKPARVSKAVAAAMSRKGYGDEPRVEGMPTESQYGSILNWYSCTCGPEEAREFLEAYLTAQGRGDEVSKLSRLHDQWLPRTAAWVSRLAMNGVELRTEWIEFLEVKLAAALDRVPGEIDAAEAQTARTARQAARVDLLTGEIEALIDSGQQFSMFDWLGERGVSIGDARQMLLKYALWYDELLEAMVGRDSQLREAYQHMDATQLRERAAFMEGITGDLERYASGGRNDRR
jgi:hypothetical protein